MSANTNPIYTITPIDTWAKITAADSTMDGTGTNVILAYTAGTNGGFLQRLIFQPISTSGSTTTSAAAARVYLNNGTDHTTATNNILMKEISLAAIAVNVTGTVGVIGYELPFNIQVAAGYTIYVGITAFAANTQWNVVPIAGNY